MSNYTLNQLEADLRTFASDHRQVNSYGFGDLWEISSSGVTDYPLMWVLLNQTAVLQNQVEWDFSVLIMDKVDKAENNETKVLSDTHSIGLDLLADLQMKSGRPNIKYPFIFKHPGVTMEPFTERFGDEVSGWKIDLKIRTDYQVAQCEIPY